MLGSPLFATLFSPLRVRIPSERFHPCLHILRLHAQEELGARSLESETRQALLAFADAGPVVLPHLVDGRKDAMPEQDQVRLVRLKSTPRAIEPQDALVARSRRRASRVVVQPPVDLLEAQGQPISAAVEIKCY